MKPVRIMRDIVRPKTARSANGARTLFGNIKGASRAVRRSFSVKIPFFICFVAILAEAVGIVKFAPNIIPLVAPQFSDAGTSPDMTVTIPQETAMAQNVVTILSVNATSSATSSDMLPEIQPGLLPVVQMPSFGTTSTAMSTMASASSTSGKKVSQPKPAPARTTITALSLLGATTLTTTEDRDGPYKVALVTNAGTYGNIAWDLTDTTLAVSKSMPSFSVAFSCDPPPNIPAVDALDQSPTFNVGTSYVCTVNLTATSGSDRKTQSKQFSFTTGAGQLVITQPSSMNTVLTDNTNRGGFVFQNDDAAPVTVNGLDIDVSYQGLNITNSPLILRFEDPATEASIADYHLENLSADPSVPYGYAGIDIHVPLSFTIGAASQKMLPLEILGVHRLGIYGVNPTITITLRQVAINKTQNKIVLNSARISWSCIVPLGAYDPNATSGPYATGQACLQ